MRKERAGIELLLCARILIPTMHHGSRRLLPDCVDAPSGWSERLVPTTRRVMWRQSCVEGNGVAWNMQLPLMARSPPRRLLVALRHCGKDGVEEASLQSTPARHRLGNVRGKFLPLAVGNPIQHAIGLTLGRLMVWSFVNGIPRAAMTGLMTQMTLAGVHLGDKYQDHNAMMTYTGIPVCGSERLPKPHKQSVPTNRQSMPKPVVECRHPVWLSMPCPCRCQCCTRAASW